MLPILPVFLVGLRGGTHHVTCRADPTPSFTVTADRGSAPIVSSAVVLDRDAPEPKTCPGLALVPELQPRTDRLRLVLPVENTSTSTWSVSVEITRNGEPILVPLGKLRSGRSVRKVLDLPLRTGESTVSTRLFAGP
jgi:hypothetical protein